MSTILLTGASGFIGQPLARRLVAESNQLRLPVRSPLPWQLVDTEIFPYDGIEAPTNWMGALTGVDVVVHCAWHGHDDSPAENRSNVDGTVRLATQAARAGVRRFVFVSTIKVCGERTPPGQPFTVATVPAPATPYAVSKLETERALFALTASSKMEVVIVRPPLVYGPGVKGSFLQLIKWLDRGRSLPLAGIESRHSLVSRSNLIDLLVRCIRHPAAAGHILHASDGVDMTAPGLIQQLGAALGKPPGLFYLPTWLLKASASLSGQRALVERLRAPLQVDIEHTCRLLNWAPPYPIDDALAQTVAHYRRYPQG